MVCGAAFYIAGTRPKKKGKLAAVDNKSCCYDIDFIYD
jgi:hypothetical protein